VGARGKFWNKVRLAFSSWLHSTSPLLQSLQPYLFAIGIGGALFLTFSRSAWVAAVAIVLVAAASLRRDLLLRSVPILSACFAAFLLLSVVAPSVVLRTTSADHLRRPLEAMKILLAEPYGRGLGAAGPAQHRVSDVCLHYPLGSDTSWAKARPDLCVYRGGIQVQPQDRDCRCPVIPENWYLQIGMELGVLGLVLYLILMYALLRNLLKLSTDHLSLTTSVTALFLLGVSVAGLFLHSFEDSAVAYTVWVLAAVALPRKKM